MPMLPRAATCTGQQVRYVAWLCEFSRKRSLCFVDRNEGKRKPLGRVAYAKDDRPSIWKRNTGSAPHIYLIG